MNELLTTSGYSGMSFIICIIIFCNCLGGNAFSVFTCNKLACCAVNNSACFKDHWRSSKLLEKRNYKLLFLKINQLTHICINTHLSLSIIANFIGWSCGFDSSGKLGCEVFDDWSTEFNFCFKTINKLLLYLHIKIFCLNTKVATLGLFDSRRWNISN